MNVLYRIVRRFHCHCTHHRFAVDALRFVNTNAGQRLTSWLLRHYRQYLRGAIDPDVRIRDFQNQFIHVDEGYWGGAPRVAHQWYDRLLDHLHRNQFCEAAHAAGVLSHYFTDAFNPLHTISTQRETLVHRPMELSVDWSYERILESWQNDDVRIVMQFSDRPGWLGSAMLHAARIVRKHADILANKYQFYEAIEQPTAGLDANAIRIWSEVFGLAITGWARVIERAASDAESRRNKLLPEASSMEATGAALLTSPIGLWRRRVFHAYEAFKVETLANEYFRTGKLVKNLPIEIDIKRRVIQVLHDEKRYRLERERHRKDWDAARLRQQRSGQITRDEIAQNEPQTMLLTNATTQKEPSTHPPMRLNQYDKLIDAPSIGKKTASLFSSIHLHTVGQFLAEDADHVAARLNTYWIDASLVHVWQAQARLMCQIPNLAPRDAQMLAGAGYRSASDIAVDDPRLLVSKIARFALTTPGRRYLKGNPPPTEEKIIGWAKQCRGLVATQPHLKRAA